jgi:hypothetical protein
MNSRAQRIERSHWAAGMMLVVMLMVVGCGGSQEVEETTVEVLPERARYGTLVRNAYRSDAADVNRDGQSDQFSYYRGERLVWRERDLDFDGSIDMYEFFASNGRLEERELQLDYDPAIDTVLEYRDGVLWRKQLSTTFDGQMSMQQLYDAAGNLLRIERDTDLDGRVDVSLHYAEGALTHMSRDTTGDGVLDTLVDADDL